MVLNDYDFVYEETMRLLRDENPTDRKRLGEFLLGEMVADKTSTTSFCEVLMLHLLKCLYQPEKISRSWYNSIKNSSKKLSSYVNNYKTLYNYLAEKFDDCYKYARRDAIKETHLSKDVFPENNIFEIEKLTNRDWVLDFLDEHPIAEWK